MYYNVIKYELYRLNIGPLDLRDFSGLSKNKCYDLVKATPIELQKIKYSDKRAVEIAIDKIQNTNGYQLQLDNVYTRYRQRCGDSQTYHYTLCAFLMYCEECEEYIYSFDTYDNGYVQACKHCNSEFILNL